MKVTQEKLPASQICLEIEIPAATCQQTYDEVLKNLASTANISGFRKGKVPRKILLQRLGTQRIKAAVLEQLIQNSIQEAIKQESIPALGNYKLNSQLEELVQEYQPGQPLTISASLDVPPEVNLGEYQGLNIKAEEIVYNPSEVDEFLEQRRQAKASLVPVEDRPAQLGDIAFINYDGKYTTETGEPGEAIPNVQGKDFQVELQENKFIEGFVAAIVGMNIEEHKEVTLTFPEDYPQEDLAGQAVIFSITLNEIKVKELPELDDELAKEISEFETLEELKQSLTEQFQEKAKNTTKKNIQDSIVAALLENTNLELPDTMVQKEIDQVLNQTAMQWQNMGIDLKTIFTPENIPQMRERAKDEAIQKLKKSLIIEEIAKKESITVEPEAIAEKSGQIQQELAGQNIDPQKLADFVKNELEVEKTMNWLEEKSNVELVPAGSLTAEAEGEAESEATEEAQEETSQEPTTQE